VCADAIETAGADRIVTIDLHSPQIQGFFKIPVDHLYAAPVLSHQVKSLNLENPVIVAPDTGAAKRARIFAQLLDASVAISDKVRRAHDEKAECLDIFGDVKGKDAVIVDDFTISCGTLIDVTRGLKERGANRVFAVTSHILLSQTGLERLMDSPIEMMISTDTIDNPEVRACPKVKIVSLAPLVAEAAMRIENRQTVSQLFDRVPTSVFDATDEMSMD
jgi:ribose-phosphate pyrophosphokinase